MGAQSTKRKAIAAIILLVAAQAFLFNYLGLHNYLPEGSEHWTEDWLIRYFSQRRDGPQKDIAVVLVDALSLEKDGMPPTIPVDRGWMAKLITAVDNAGAKAIGIDFYYASAIDPAKDEQLATALKNAKAPVVIAALDDEELATDKQRKFQKEFIERIGRDAGHIYLKRSTEVLTLGDRAVRLIDHDPSVHGRPSLTAQLAHTPSVAAAFGKRDIPAGPQRIDWLLPPRGNETFLKIPAYEITAADKAEARQLLKDKVVLIGPDFAKLDQHEVPFSVGSQVHYSGVFVQAQALAQILEGRFFFQFSPLQQFLLLFTIGLLGAYVGFAFHSTRIDIALGLAGTFLIVALSVPFFLIRVPMPTALVILSWATSLSIGQRVHAWIKRKAT
jgi:CHASE2 domain-containing sensor protein